MSFRFPFVLCAALALVACGANFPSLDKIEQTVLTDLAAGKSPEQIEADVAAIMCGPGAAPLCIDAVVVVNDAIAFLLHTGILDKNPVALGNAQHALSVERGKIAARHAQ